MYPSSYDFKSFYKTNTGRVVRRLLLRHIVNIWPDMKDLRCLGYGYPIPYLKVFLNDCELISALMPSGQGAHHWPDNNLNLTAVCQENDLPLETNSVDRILMVHALEFSDDPAGNFEELWRVLKSSGRLLMIVPNRMGLWARSDHSPLGQGTPYSASQLERFLRENLFVHEKTSQALFVPPFKNSLFLRSAGFFEQTGRYFYPALGGVHIIEATKQLYAGKGLKEKSRMPFPLKEAVQPKPVPTSRDKLS